MCEQVATSITLYPQLEHLLKEARKQPKVKVIVVTCGLCLVWRHVPRTAGYSDVLVLGNGQLEDPYFIRPDTKADVVRYLQNLGVYVTTFGDSKLDFPMFSAANQSALVIDAATMRPSPVERALDDLVADGTLGRVRKIVVGNELSAINILQQPDFIEQAFRCKPHYVFPAIAVYHATDKPSSKLLTTPARNALVSGPPLRHARHAAGRYLALEYLSQIIGLHEIDIPHVQGSKTLGHELKNESTTLIVALMRGGEPMALGVSEMMPKAASVPAKDPADIKPKLLESADNIILVDSVINSGQTIVDFLEHLIPAYKPNATKNEAAVTEAETKSNAKIIIVTNVIQNEAIQMLEVRCRSLLAHAQRSSAEIIATDAKFHLVALRKSENKFTGKGGTDTGNRPFITMHID